MIDAHVHAFPDAAWGRRWQTEAGFEPERPGTLDDLATRMDAAGIETAVLLLFARPGDRRREHAAAEIRALNRWGLDVARRDHRFLPFVGVDPRLLSRDELVAEIRNGAAAGARGVKVVPPAMRLYPDDPHLEPVYATCVELGLPILSQSGAGGSAPPGPRGPYGTPSAWDAVLRRFPDLRVILAHLGHGFEDELVEIARSHPTLFADMSLRLGSPRDADAWDDAAAERTLALVRRIGADRVLFGTNYPITDPVIYAHRFRQLGLGDAEQERIARTNTQQVLGPSRPPTA